MLIKFRAKVKADGLLVDIQAIDFVRGVIIVWAEGYGDSPYGGAPYGGGYGTFKFDEVVIQQAIDYDSNGVAIYEGDTLEISPSLGEVFTAVVMWISISELGLLLPSGVFLRWSELSRVTSYRVLPLTP